MPARHGALLASTAAVMAVAATMVAASGAETRGERPRGALESCASGPGWGGESDFSSRLNLVVGPLAVGRARLGWGENGDGFGFDKLFVFVRGAHRVTVELSRSTRKDVGLAFGSPRGATKGSDWNLRNTRRIVSFVACQRGERIAGAPRFDGWPVTSWVGFLLARSPTCVPLRGWVDDEPSPRRAVIRFGVRTCE
jgi:hypothetical protein